MVTIAFSDRLVMYAEGHLLSAVRFSRMVGELERVNKGYQDEQGIRDYATACVFAAVAALEAYANELFFQPQTTFPEHPAKLVSMLWEASDRKRVLDKFDLALKLKDRPVLVRGCAPTQDIALLIDLRNALVHFKPEWESEAAQHSRLSDSLRSKFKPSKFLEEPIFPNSWPSLGCTEWAVNSVLNFEQHFQQQSGMIPRFKRTRQIWSESGV